MKFKGKSWELIALASIVGILVGFGYRGAIYVNRIEDIEAKVAAINKTIDESLLLWLREAEESISVIEVSVGKLQSKIDTIPDLSPVEGNISVIRVDLGKIESNLDSLEKQLEKLEDKDANPLAGL